MENYSAVKSMLMQNDYQVVDGVYKGEIETPVVGLMAEYDINSYITNEFEMVEKTLISVYANDYYQALLTAFSITENLEENGFLVKNGIESDYVDSWTKYIIKLTTIKGEKV